MLQRLVDEAGRRRIVVVRAADRFRDDAVDQTQCEQVRRGDLQCRRRLHFSIRVAPEDCGASLGRDDAIDGELLHQYPVANRDPQRPTAAPFAADDHDDGDADQHHLPQVYGDRFGDAALFGFHAGICGRRVDEDDDRPAELLGQLHDPQRFSIPFRARVAEVPEDLLLRVASFLVPHHTYRLLAVLGEARDDRVIVGKPAIAVEFIPAGEQPLDVIERVRPVRMSRDKDPLPRGEVRVELAADLIRALPETLDRTLPLRRLREHAERFDLLEEDTDGLFELE